MQFLSFILYLNIETEKLNNKYSNAIKIKKYKKLKKKLFSFNNYLSTKEFFYNKTKYHLCYKIKNHLSEEFTRILISPIIDMENYLPQFSQFDTKNLFKQTDLNKKSLYKITNLNLIKFFLIRKKK